MALKSVNKIESNDYEIEVSVDGATFEGAIQKAYNKQKSRVNVPGFRRGKAPRAFIEKMYGAEFFYEDAVNDLYSSALNDALDESDLDVIDNPGKIEMVEIGKDGFTFKTVVTVKPAVEVGAYKELPATKKVHTVADEEVENEISRLRERNSRIITVEDRAAEMGDMSIIDFDGSVDGVPFEGGKAEDHSLTLGSGQFIPGFEEQIVGHSVGDAFEVTVTFPEDYHASDLAGKPAVFKTTLKELKTRELPELDDEFAKDVSEYDTLEELKADLRGKLSEHADKHADDDVENQLIDQLIDGLTAEIPQVMLDRRIDENVNDFAYRLQQQGLDLDTYLQYTNMEKDSFRKTFQEQAERQVKVRLALEKIAEIEEITPSEEELDAEYQKIADAYRMEIDKVKGMIPAKDIAKDVAVEKAIRLVKESAKITEVPEESEEASKDAGPAPSEQE